MNKHFMAGFEKKASMGKEAFLGSAAGKLVGAVRKVPHQMGQLYQGAKALPGKVRAGLQNMRELQARKFKAMQAKQMGFAARQGTDASFKGVNLNLSANTPKLKVVDGQKQWVKPPKKQPGPIAKGLNHAKNLAIAGTVVGGTGLYYGVKDPEQPQSQPRQGYGGY